MLQGLLDNDSQPSDYDTSAQSTLRLQSLGSIPTRHIDAFISTFCVSVRISDQNIFINKINRNVIRMYVCMYVKYVKYVRMFI